ncbi:MAG: HIT family protein [Flavobacteriales bacterium]|mgnify:CR=1 FL=1|nr:HIT family protein [Flavobacteriales bacterium]
MPTIFSRIISGEIPCHKVAENEKFIAFLDIQPVARGHVLVIPKMEVDYFFDLDKEILSEINLFARDVAKKIERVVPCKRIGVAIVGLEVPHAHVHLIPLNKISDISFTGERLKLSNDELAELAMAISLA